MRLIVALDGSKVGEGALAAVAPWARDSRAEVHLLRVLNPRHVHDTSSAEFVSSVPRGGAAFQGEFAPVATVAQLRTFEDRTQAMARAREKAEDYLRTMAGRYPPGETATVAVQWASRPAEAIVGYAETIKADLIVMGTHGRSGLSHALLGSVAEETIRRAPIPVTVIRQGITPFAEKEAPGKKASYFPDGTGGKERLLSFLHENHVTFWLSRHPSAISAVDLAAFEAVPPASVAKSIAFAADGRYVLAVVPGSSRVDADRLRLLIGANNLEIVDEPDLALLFPDCELGALHPFGNLYDLPVYVDSALEDAGDIVFHAGTHRDAVSVTSSDYFRLVDPVVGHIRRPSGHAGVQAS